MTIWMQASSPDLTRRPNLVGDHDCGSRRTPEQQATGMQTPECTWAPAGMTILGEHDCASGLLELCRDVTRGSKPILVETST